MVRYWLLDRVAVGKKKHGGAKLVIPIHHAGRFLDRKTANRRGPTGSRRCVQPSNQLAARLVGVHGAT
jgi:hypothetical protein